MNDKILGVMVTYNPDMQTLHSDIDAVLSQVETVLVYDNASKNQNELKHFFEQFPTVSFFANNENNGLPKCYNSAMRYGMRGVQLVTDFGSGHCTAKGLSYQSSQFI